MSRLLTLPLGHCSFLLEGCATCQGGFGRRLIGAADASAERVTGWTGCPAGCCTSIGTFWEHLQERLPWSLAARTFK